MAKETEFAKAEKYTRGNEGGKTLRGLLLYSPIFAENELPRKSSLCIPPFAFLR